MANAHITLKPITRPIEAINLSLNESELSTLMVILNRIGGCPDNSPRKHADSIHQAILKAIRDAKDCHLDMLKEEAAINGAHARVNSIYFDDYKG